MPLLSLEPTVFPEMLLSSEELPMAEGSWWVLHTRPRAEKALARRLLGRSISFFLPLYRRQWRSNNRQFDSYLPLFSGYLFLHGENEDRVHALETNLVARTLKVEDQSQFHADLARVHQMLVAGVTIAPEDRLQPGNRVEIVSGPLVGMQGKILARDKKMRFFIEVQFLQQGVSVEIESWMIRPITKELAMAAAPARP